MEDERTPNKARERGDEGEPIRSGPAWRSWVVSIFVAILLSAAATLLLGGGFPFGGDGSGAGCCGPRAACCPERPDGAGGGR